MQRKTFKTITALLLVVCMIGVLVMSTACNKESGSDPTSVFTSVIGGDSAKSSVDPNEGGAGSSATTPSSNSGAATPGSATNPDQPETPAAVDRSEYTTATLATKVMETSVYDFAEVIASGDRSFLEGYMVGDVINSLILTVGEMGIIPNADFSAFCYTCYEDGTWESLLAPRANKKIVSALLGYKLDGSEPFALTEQDIETYGDEKLIDLLGFGNNALITTFAKENAIVRTFANTKLKDVAALFGAYDEPAVDAVLNIIGDLKCGEIAGIFGIEKDLGELADKTVRELYESASPKVEEAIDDYNEGGFEGLAADAIGIAMELLNEYSDFEVIPGVTVGEIFLAVSGDKEALNDIVKVAEEFAIAYAQTKVAELKESMGDAYETYKDMAVYGEYTLDELLTAFETSTPDEIVAIIEAEYLKLTTEEGYVLQVVSPWTMLISQYVTEFEIAEGVTVGDVIYALMDFDGEDSAEAFEALIDFVESIIYSVSGAEIDFQAIFESVYPFIEDIPVYYNAEEEREYTFGEILSATIELDSITAVIAKAEELFSDPDVTEGVKTALINYAVGVLGTLKDVFVEMEVIEGVTGGDILNALSDFEDEASKETFKALLAYADEMIASYGVATTVEEIYEQFYPMIKDIVVYLEYDEEGELVASYTVGDFVTEAINCNSVSAIFYSAIEWFSTHDLVQGVKNAAAGLLIEASNYEIVEGVTVIDAINAIMDPEAEGSQETIDSLKTTALMTGLQILSYVITNYGDVEIYEGITVNNILTALMDTESEEAKKLIEVCDALAEQYIGITVTDALAIYNAISEVVIYGEYTVGDIVGMVTSGEIVEFVNAEIEKIKEDTNYALEAFTPAIELVLTVIEPYSDTVILDIFEAHYTVAYLIEDANMFLNGSIPINALQAFAILMGKNVGDYADLIGVSAYLPAIENEDFNAFMDSVLSLSVAEVVSGDSVKEVFVDYLKELKVGEVMPLIMQLSDYYGLNLVTVEEEVVE